MLLGSVAPLDTAVQAPHVTFTTVASGLLWQLITRPDFGGKPMNVADPVLEAAGSAGRETRIREPEVSGVWRLDMRMPGLGRTLFLDV